jgi:hypothetical protein
MTGYKTLDKSIDTVMKLKGADSLKSEVKRLHVFNKNRAEHALVNASPPNYFWVVKRGGGVTTTAKAFTEYLYTSKAIEFCGLERFFEFTVNYVAPEAFFGELTRLDKTISALAGHNRFYKGVACINIDEWVGHTEEDHFARLLEYIASNNDRLLFIFYIHTDENKFVETIESALSARVRLETLMLRFPTVTELVELVEEQIEDKGFTLSGSSKALLSETITEIVAGKRFNGFKSIEQLINDITFNILSTDLGEKKKITADMLVCYSKDSAYVKRIKIQGGLKRIIGFAERGM